MRPEEEMEHEMCSQHAGQLQARIRELEQENADAQRGIESVRGINAELQAQLQAVTQRSEKQQQINLNLISRNSKLEQQLQAAQKERDTQAKIVEEICEGDDNLQITNDKLLDDIEVLQAQLAAVTQERNTLRNKLERNRKFNERAQLQAHNKALRGALREITDLELAWTPIPQSTIDKCRSALTLTQEKP